LPKPGLFRVVLKLLSNLRLARSVSRNLSARPDGEINRARTNQIPNPAVAEPADEVVIWAIPIFCALGISRANKYVRVPVLAWRGMDADYRFIFSDLLRASFLLPHLIMHRMHHRQSAENTLAQAVIDADRAR
jgi:hypothetical protein